MFGGDKNEHRIIELLEKLLKVEQEIKQGLFPSRLTIHFTGASDMSSPAVTLNLEPTPQTTNGTVTETVNGQPVTPVPANLTWSVQDSTVVSFTQNPDGSCTFTALKVGVTQVGCVDSVTGNSGVGTITVAQGVIPGTLTISFSTPQPPSPDAVKLEAKKV